MAITAPLPSVYTDFSPEEFGAELTRIHDETAIERQWTGELGLPHFETDQEILDEVEQGRLLRVEQGVGYIAIPKLANWQPNRTDPEHPFHYSPPYLRQEAVSMLGLIGHEWARDGSGFGHWSALAVTSMIRSDRYQTRLAKQYRKATIDPEVGLSSHVFGPAFDIDGRGLYRLAEGEPVPINSRDNPEYSGDIERSRNLLRSILDEQKSRGSINYVEEMPGTQEHLFHVCVKPHALEPVVVFPQPQYPSTLKVPVVS